MTVLLLGGTGRVGSRVLTQLLQRNIRVKAIVRTTTKLPQDQRDNPLLTPIQANLTSLTTSDIQSHLPDVTAVISCLGHVIGFKGILFEECFVHSSAVTVVDAITAFSASSSSSSTPSPIKFIHLSTVGILHPAGLDPKEIRGSFERGFISALRVVVPLRDSQRTVRFLHSIHKENKSVEWVAVRPDAFMEGDVSEYKIHPHIVSSLFKAGKTTMSNIAHFMCELVEKKELWDEWKGKMPVIVDVETGAAGDGTK